MCEFAILGGIELSWPGGGYRMDLPAGSASGGPERRKKRPANENALPGNRKGH